MLGEKELKNAGRRVRTRISQPCDWTNSMKADPIKPDPPVTRIQKGLGLVINVRNNMTD